LAQGRPKSPLYTSLFKKAGFQMYNFFTNNGSQDRPKIAPRPLQDDLQQFFLSSQFLSSISILLCHLLVPSWAPKSVQITIGSQLCRVKKQRSTCGTPRCPKSGPRCTQDRPRAPKNLPRRPKTSPEGSKMPARCSQTTPNRPKMLPISPLSSCLSFFLKCSLSRSLSCTFVSFALLSFLSSLHSLFY